MMIKDKEYPVIHENVSPGYDRDISHLENLMVTVCKFTNGPAQKPDSPHSHPHEQITYVADGSLKFFKGEIEFKLNKGDLIAIPSGMPHCIQIISKSVTLIDSFSPVRTDFLKK